MTKLDHEREASAWSGTELVRPPLEITLDGRQRAELLATLDSLRSSGLGIVDVEPGHVRLPSLAADIARIDTEVRDGSGFALVHGFPVEGLTVPEIELAYWALCTQLGTGVTQNSDAGFIHYVTDGELRPQQGKRGVGNPGPTPLHVDLSDCVSLLCVRQARDDPPSWLASSTYVYHEVARRRPDLAELLHRGFEWDRLEEHRPGEDPSSGYLVPLFSEVDGKVSCRYNRYWMAAAAKRSGRRWPAEVIELLDLVDEVAHAHRLEVAFQPGDIQFVNNYTVLHGRAEHVHEPDEAAKRLLLRIWLDFEPARPVVDPAIVRYGVIRHGLLGYSAADIRRGAHLRERVRRPDGATVVGTSEPEARGKET